jgi:hypothetical protein
MRIRASVGQLLGEAFGCPVRTAQRVNAVVLDPFVWQEKVKNADYRLLPPLEGVARQLLAAWESNARFARKVQAIIVQHLDGRVPGIEPVARQLALSHVPCKGGSKPKTRGFTRFRPRQGSSWPNATWRKDCRWVM